MPAAGTAQDGAAAIFFNYPPEAMPVPMIPALSFGKFLASWFMVTLNMLCTQPPLRPGRRVLEWISGGGLGPDAGLVFASQIMETLMKKR
ncbi:hypothetical protein SY88_16305 [Clostridiales bacterium PH28_bin88]|nr:hypothetical protein SY88_16305 [Clostridiales bacterium PH28_bin88]